MSTTYNPTIGLEIHAHLITKSKMFSTAPNHFGDAPNTNVTPLCIGMPGTLPVPNIEAIKQSILAGLALNCEIPKFTKWDRKHYYYPDLPKGYQISQFDLPLCGKGQLEITKKDGSTKTIGITRAHLEEDAGKLNHTDDDYSLVDLNRAGAPLLEIVSEPDIATPEEAVLYAKKIHTILSWIGVNNGNLQEGAMRFDVNVSVRPEDQKEFGTKVELKNLNSFRSLERSLFYEIDRQTKALEAGEEIIQETRLWDVDEEVSRSMRTKEDAHDYRYFPEPDIPPFEPSEAFIDDLRKQLPLLPDAVKQELQESLKLSELDASTITGDKAVYDLFATTLEASKAHQQLGKQPEDKQAKAIANWLSGLFLELLRTEETDPRESNISSKTILELLELLEANTISSTVAKEVFTTVFKEGGSPQAIVKEKGLAQISDSSELESIVKTVVDNNPDSVKSIVEKGKMGAIGFLVGQVMKETKGKANPKMVNKLLKKALQV